MLSKIERAQLEKIIQIEISYNNTFVLNAQS
jgi:hypothetical protein